MTRECRQCGNTKAETAFDRTKTGLRRVCRACRTKRRTIDADAHLAYNREHRARNPARYIVIDCRSWDKKKGLDGNDLDLSFVEILISQGCSYCGETQLRIALDRIDNTQAHSKSNVVPSCIRCNYLRGSMPYAAWLHLAPAVREAREQGLFGAWRSEALNKTRR